MKTLSTNRALGYFTLKGVKTVGYAVESPGAFFVKGGCDMGKEKRDIMGSPISY
jgi:hypothetical protein